MVKNTQRPFFSLRTRHSIKIQVEAMTYVYINNFNGLYIFLKFFSRMKSIMISSRYNTIQNILQWLYTFLLINLPKKERSQIKRLLIEDVINER